MVNGEREKRGRRFFWLAISASLITFCVGIAYLIYLVIVHPPHMGG